MKAFLGIGLLGAGFVRAMVNKVSPLIKGGGGGQKTLASAGGQDASRLEEVIQRVKDLL